jgi:serine protease Do
MRRFLLVLSLCLLSLPVLAQERRTPVVMAVEKASPAVVNIRTEQIVQRRSSPFFGFSDPFFNEFFGELAPPRSYRTQSLGSGVVIDERGHVLTNAHVIAKASKIYVALPDRRKELEATLVGMDERIDLAVLRIEGKGPFPVLPAGRSDDLLVGETVIAIGNPLGLGHSITTGIISAQRRRIPTGEGIFSVFIQTDASINPGNSGGPLLNIRGELIGINTAIARQAQGIGFAIPIDTARRVLGDLIEHGRVRQAWLGVIPGPVGGAFTRAHGEGGVLVNGLDEPSPAAGGGLKMADVLLALDDNPVASPAELLSLLRTYTPGDRARISVLRGTRELEVQVRLAAIPEGYGRRYAEKVFGLVVGDGRSGLEVIRVIPASPADKAGVRKGDVLAEVAGVRPRRAEDFNRLIEEQAGLEPLRFLIVRGNRGHLLELP